MKTLLLLIACVTLALAGGGDACPSDVAQCDVGVAKAGPSLMIIGFPRPYEYQINIPNAGPDAAANVQMVDDVPAPLVVTGVQGSYSNGTIFCSRAGNRVNCTIPVLQGGDTARVIVSVTIPSNVNPINITNVATVNSTTCDNDMTNNQRSASSSVELSADLAINIEGASFGIAGQAEVLNETVTLINLGSSDAQAVTATFFVPVGIEFVSVQSAQGSCSYNPTTRLVTCQYGTVASLASRVFIVSTRVPPDTLIGTDGGIVTFEARVNSTTPDPNLDNNVDRHTLDIRIDSNLSVTKSGASSVIAGQPELEVYTIVVENSGPSAGLGVQMFDQIPSVFQLVSVVTFCNTTITKRGDIVVRENVPCGGTITCSINSPNNFLSCNIGFLGVNQRVLIEATFSVNANVPDQSVVNTANVISSTTDSDATRNSDSHITRIESLVDVLVQKTGPTSVIISGDGVTYTYTFTVRNDGPSVARDVRFTDSVPQPMVLQGGVIVLNGPVDCSRTGNFIDCSFGNLQPQESRQFAWQFIVPANAQTLGFIENCANVTTQTQETNLSNNRDCTVTQVVAAPDPEIFKFGPASIVVDNSDTTYFYTVRVVNNGPSNAQNVWVEDPLPAPFIVQPGIQVTQGSATCVATVSNFVNCTIGFMAPLASVTIVIPFKVPPNAPATTVVNKATVYHTTPDTNTTNNEAEVPTVLIRLADVAVDKSGPTLVCAGAPQQFFTVTVTNLGPTDATGVELTDVLNAVFVPGSNNAIAITGNFTPATCSFSLQTLTCLLGGIPFGQTVRVLIPFRVASSTAAQNNVPNTAVVTSTSNDPVASNNQDTHFTNICNDAPVTVVKNGPATAVAGSPQLLQYTLLVSNPAGPSDAINARVEDLIPSQFTYVTNSVSATGGGTCSVVGRNLTCSWSRLVPGQSELVSFLFTVDQAVPPQVVTNCGLFQSQTPPQNVAQSCTNTTVLQQDDVSVSKFGPSTVCAGDGQTWFYTVQVFNSGPSRATNIRIVDPLPTGLIPGNSGLISISGNEDFATCSYVGTELRCTLGGLRVGSVIVVTFPFSAPANLFQTTVLNTVFVTADQDTNSANNQASIATPICNLVDMTIDKEGPAAATAGSGTVYSYNLTVRNLGISDAINVTVRDPIPRDFTVIGAPVATGGGVCSYTVESGQTVLNCQWPRFVPQTQVERVTISFTVGAGITPGPRTNCARVDAPLQQDTNGSNNEDCVTTQVDVQADLVAFKSGPGSICAGFGGEFTITVTNGGPAIAENANLTDTLPIQFTPGPASSISISGNETFATCGFSGQVLICQLGRMSVGRTIIVRYSVTVARSVRPIAAVTNVVVVNATTPDGNQMNNQAEHDTEICANANMRARKGAPVEAIAGQGVYRYELTIINDGPAMASSATLTDVVPADFTPGAIISTGTAESCSFGANNDLTCFWNGLFGVGQSETIVFEFTVRDTVLAGSRVNCVTVGSSTNDPQPGDNTACNSTLVRTRADVAAVKTGPASLCAGSDVAFFTVVVTNNGPSVARTVTLSDPLPAGLSPVAGTVSIIGAAAGASCGYTGSVLQCTLLDMAVNAQIRIVFPFRVQADVLAANVTNIAEVDSVTADENRANNIAPWPVRIDNCADYSIVKTGPTVPVIAGDSTVSSFVLTVRNAGPSDARNVVVNDPNLLVADITILSVNSARGATCSVIVDSAAARRVQCTLAVLPAGTTDTITILFTSPASAVPGSRTNCALVSSSTPAVGNGLKESCWPYIIQSTADLRTVKTGVVQVVAGENLSNQVFTVTVTNIGGSDARGATLTDSVPATLQLQTVSTSVGSCNINNNAVSCNFGTLAPGASAVVTYTFRTVPSAALGVVRNVACADTTTDELVTNNNCDDWDTLVICRTVLVPSKTVNINSIVAGSSTIGTFVLGVTNNGPSTSFDTQVTDTWPAQLTLQGSPSPSQGTCAITATGFFCNIGRLDPGQSANVTVSFTVAASVLQSVAVNVACFRNSCSSDVCASASVQISRDADLCISKDDGVDSLQAGSNNQYTYTITVTNNGFSDARNVVVSDVFPSVLLRGDIEAPGAECTLTSTGFTCSYEEPLSPGESRVILVEYRVPSVILSQYVSNCARVSSSTPDRDLENNIVCDTNNIINAADLEIKKTIDQDDCITAGSQLTRTYTLQVTNFGPTIARNVVVRERFPQDLVLLSFPPQCVRNPAGSSNFTCSLGDMVVGQVNRLFFTFRVAASQRPGLVENYAEVGSDTFDPELCNNNATLCTAICVESDLAITKTDNVLEVTAGDGITYTYTIVARNFGPSDAPTVTIHDTWPLNAWGIGVITAPAGVNCTRDSEGFTCEVEGGLAVNESITITVTYTVPPCLDDCQVCNTVSISSSTSPDPNGDNNVATDCNKVRTEADIEVCKEDGVTHVVAGENTTYTYTITVKNNGPSCAQKVRLVDHFPPEVIRLGNVVITQGTCVNVGPANDFSCHLLTLQPGQTVLVYASYTVPSTAETCSITNVATVSTVTFDPRLCNNDYKDVNALIEKARLWVEKTDNTVSFPQGDYGTREYVITYWNSGPSTARDVVMTDRWPSMFVQYLQSIRTSVNTTCISTGGDFTCTSGDVAVGERVEVRIRYSLMHNAPCGVVTNKVSVFSPTDEECRNTEDNTTVTCLSQTELCRNCIDEARNSSICGAKYQACLQSATCTTCFNSIIADPTRPANICFSDPQSCDLMACTYNDACGLGAPPDVQDRRCDSPNSGPVTCPPLPAKREIASRAIEIQTAVPAAVTVPVPTPGLERLAPKRASMTTSLEGKVLHIKLRNTMSSKVVMQSIVMQVDGKSVSLTETSDLVKDTKCSIQTAVLRKNWSYSCSVTFVSVPKEMTIIAHGFSEVKEGVHTVIASSKVTQQK